MNGATSRMDVRDVFAERLAAQAPSLAPAARRVVRFIDQNRALALASSAVELAQSTGTSDATVIRSVQALGFAGLGELKQALVAAIVGPSTPADDMRRTLDDSGEDTAGAVRAVLDAHGEAFQALQSPEACERMVRAISALHPARRIVVFGIGPSAALASYAAMLLGRSGRRSRTLDVSGIMLADQLLDLQAGDALLILSYGRAYREVLTVSGEARRLDLPLVLVTDDAASRIGRAATAVLPAQRGRAQRVALHGATLVCLEALILGLAAADRATALDALQRLNALRASVSGQQDDVG